jgi:hypothetical protein
VGNYVLHDSILSQTCPEATPLVTTDVIIAITLICPQKGEQTAQACVMAFYEKVIKVKADVAAYLS